MKYLLIIIFATVFISGCDKDDFEYIPECLANQIEDLSQSTCEGNVSIVKYFFQSTVVYIIYPGFCYIDQSYDIINSNCEFIGTIGGFAGPEINGVDFYKNAVFLKVVWEK